MDYTTPSQTLAQNAKNWRSGAAMLRSEAASKIAQAEEMEKRAEVWEAAAEKIRDDAP